MSRLKDEIIEQIDRLGDVLDLCNDEIEAYKNGHTTDSFDHGILAGRKELAEAILKLIKGEDE